MCLSPVKKGRVKSIFSFSPLLLLEKHIQLLSSAPPAYFMESQSHSDFCPCPSTPKHQLSCSSRVMQSTPQPSPNDTQPLSLNLKRKPVQIPPVFKEIPAGMLLGSCPWSTVAILSCEAPAGTRGSLRSLPSKPFYFPQCL